MGRWSVFSPTGKDPQEFRSGLRYVSRASCSSLYYHYPSCSYSVDKKKLLIWRAGNEQKNTLPQDKLILPSDSYKLTSSDSEHDSWQNSPFSRSKIVLLLDWFPVNGKQRCWKVDSLLSIFQPPNFAPFLKRKNKTLFLPFILLYKKLALSSSAKSSFQIPFSLWDALSFCMCP